MASTTAKLRMQFADLKFTPLKPPSEHPRYAQFGLKLTPPETTLLPAGHVKAEGKRTIPVDTIFERDLQISMRDGVKIYTDVFRPAQPEGGKVPAIIAWSPYGKSTGGYVLDNYPQRIGVPPDRNSGYEKFEAPDPADWCKRGYAIVNPDARGALFSEGSLFLWGTQEAEDIYDTIDWISKQPWCNGSVCMAGNSWLAVAQVSFASRLSHPALKAIAPWEGFTDLYRLFICAGGIPTNQAFLETFLQSFTGPNDVEDVASNLRTHPLFDEYWADKCLKLEDIEIPIYILAGYVSFHCPGSFATFIKAKSKQKWLRSSPFMEWYELYRPEANDDLQRFFDRYCKGIMNGWEMDTPPIRLTFLGYEGSIPSVLDRAEQEFPLKRQQLKRLYLDGEAKRLVESSPPEEAKVFHEAHDLHASSDFVIHFDKYTEIAGYIKIRVWMSCEEKDDMDVFAQVRKIGRNGEVLAHLNFPIKGLDKDLPSIVATKYYGPQGSLRASHLISYDKSESSDDGQVVFYKHDSQEKIPPGKPVALEITLWPAAIVFAAGEGIMLRISGHNMDVPFSPFPDTEPTDENIGRHAIHTGGQYGSYVVVPVVGEDRP